HHLLEGKWRRLGRGDAQPMQPRSGQHQTVDVAGLELSKSRVDVASKRNRLEIRMESSELRSPPQARRPNDRARTQSFIAPADEHIEGIGAFGDGTNHDS